MVAAGGVRPRRGRGLKSRCLALAQREEIALGRGRGQSVRSIAAAIRHWAGVTPSHRWLGAEAPGPCQAIRPVLRDVAFRA